MKKLFTATAIVLVASMALLPSCKKKEDPAPSKEQLLTRSGGWKITAELTGSADTYASMQDCDKDDVLKFTLASGNTSAKYAFDEGATKCDASDPQTEDSGTWSLNAAKTVLTITPDTDDPVSVTIVELTSTTFKISYIIDDGGSQVTIIDTYTGI